MIIVFIASAVLGWGNIKNDISANNKDIAQLRMEVTAMQLKQTASDTQIISLSGDIREIKTSLIFIRQALTGK